jgi:hypothetical protein
MAASMKSVTETGVELSNEERNLLSVAYKVGLVPESIEWLYYRGPVFLCGRMIRLLAHCLHHSLPPANCLSLSHSRVVDPHWFNEDPDSAFFLIADPDPHLNADPNPVPDPRFLWTKIEKKKLQLEILWSKIASYLFLGLPKGRPSYRRSLQPSTKESIQHFKTWKFFTFFYFCG